MEDDLPVTKVIFNAVDIRAVLDEAIQDGLDDLWLVRGVFEIYLTLPTESLDDMRTRVAPYTITRLRSQIFADKDPPYVEILPHHDCVLRKIAKSPVRELLDARVEIHYSTVSEYRLYLTRRPND